MLVGYNPLGDYVNFFRFMVINFKITTETIDFAIKEIETLAEDIEV